MKFAVMTIGDPARGHNRIFEEVSEVLCAALAALGHHVVATFNTAVNGRINLVLGACLLDAAQALPPDSILLNLEQLAPGSPWAREDYFARLARHRVWDYSRANLALLAARGIAATHVLLGHAPELELIAPSPEPGEDIDVLFYGALNERRTDILNDLSAYGAKVKLLRDVYGAERDAWIARSRIVLNIHFYPTGIFEAPRVFYLLCNGRFVVSERGADAADDADWADGLAFADESHIVDACMEYLQKPEERRAIALRGQALMRARPMAEVLRRAMGFSSLSPRERDRG